MQLRLAPRRRRDLRLPRPKWVGSYKRFDNSTSGNNNVGDSSITWSHTVGTGNDRLLVVSVSFHTAARTVTGVTYNGVALTKASHVAGATDRVELWYLVAPATGTHNVVVSLSTSGTAAGTASSWFGVEQTSPLGTVATNTGSGDLDSDLTVTTASGDLVVDALTTHGASATHDPNSPQVKLEDLGFSDSGTNHKSTASWRRGAGATSAMGWSTSQIITWSAIGVGVHPVGSITPVTGTAVANLGGLSATAIGTVTVPGTAVSSLGGINATIVGKVTIPGTAAANLGGLTATAIGTPTVKGTALSSLGPLTATASGGSIKSGTAVASLGGLSATIVGKVTRFGTAISSLGRVSATITGTRIVSGTAQSSLGSLTATATGLPKVLGIASSSLGSLTATATGTVIPGSGVVFGTASSSLGPLSATITAKVTIPGTAISSFGGLTAIAIAKRSVFGTAIALLGGVSATITVPVSNPDIPANVTATFTTSCDTVATMAPACPVTLILSVTPAVTAQLVSH